MADLKRSAGSQAFAAIVRRVGAVTVARELRCTAGACGNWAAGRRSPTPAVRRGIAKRYQVDAALWDAPPIAEAATLPQDEPTPPSTPRQPSRATNAPPRGAPRGRKGSTLPPSGATAPHGKPDPQDLAQRLVVRIERELELAQGNEAYTPRERASLASAGTSALRLYSRLAGSLEVTQAAIVRSAAWGRILRAFERVFAKHPEAAKALAEFSAELEDLGE